MFKNKKKKVQAAVSQGNRVRNLLTMRTVSTACVDTTAKRYLTSNINVLNESHQTI